MSNVKSQKLKVFVGMSGGVDSSVAAALLKKHGYEVIGVHLKCWSQRSSDALRVGAPLCGAEQDAEDARRAAEVLNIPFYVFDFEKEYKEKVVEYMIGGYRNGITPNPDVMCNKEIKFGLFLKKALEMGADYVATGHYVRKRDAKLRMHANLQKNKFVDSDKFVVSHWLYQAKDKNKDQSYFLWTLTQEQLKHCLFPIGDYAKPEVRKLARKFGLPNAEKKDSQGICFLGQVTLKDFLGNYLPQKRGLVLNTSGKVVGEHSGAHFYTIGQRNGLGIGGNEKPVYVAEKDVEENAILVAEGEDSALYKKEIELRNINFTNPLMPLIRANMGNKEYDVLVRVRYRQPLFPAILKKSHQSSVNSYKLIFETPQKFVASGQSAVFYESRPSTGSRLKMLGGGIII